LRGKAHGAWILHELTRDLPLDFFVLYSAAGTFLGASGQGAYPAANAELDALARARRRLGLPALSVAWGAWADVGMMAALAGRGSDVWAARGLGTITSDLGFSVLERLLRDAATAAVVLPIDWSQFLAHLPSGVDRSFFAAVAADKLAIDATGQRAEAVNVVSELRALPAGQRKERLAAQLMERARQVIGLDATTPVNPRVPLKELGLDSLMAVELRNVLARAIGQPLPATLLFDYPTVDALADYLMPALALGRSDEQEPVPSARASSRAEDVDSIALAGLSDDEAEALLLKEIETGFSRKSPVGSGYDH
jgi:acyl carrier protein